MKKSMVGFLVIALCLGMLAGSGAVAANAHNVVGVHCRGDYAVVGIDHNDVMPFGRELLCQS